MALKIPDPPYIAAGAFGGPVVMMFVTPMRNALTLGAMDHSKSVLTLYKNVFRGGFGTAFAGGKYMSMAATPGFLVLGPCYHMFKDLCGGSNVGAVALTSVSETCIFYGSETKNAQTAYNIDCQKSGAKPIGRLQNQFKPYGPGVGLHIARNALAMSGLRVFSDPAQTVIQKAAPDMSPTSRAIFGDLLANVVVSAMSTPLHQLYGFSVTHRVAGTAAGYPELSMPQASLKFLRNQYFTPAGGISSVAARDMVLRVMYNATIYSVYGQIERSLVANWPQSLLW